MKPDSALVSVIIPSFNGENYLKEALQSVLDQTLPVSEIIIVDDGSLMPVAELDFIDTNSIRVIRQENSGQGSAINAGIALAREDLIAFLDHDDKWNCKKNSVQTKLLLENNLDVVVGQVTNVWTRGDEIIKFQPMGTARLFGACLFKKEVFSKIGPIAEGRHIHEIIDWWSRAGESLQIGKTNQVDLFRRVHGENMTLQSNHKERHDLFLRLRENIKRNHGKVEWMS